MTTLAEPTNMDLGISLRREIKVESLEFLPFDMIYPNQKCRVSLIPTYLLFYSELC
jgi:hypothetical protein